jgi:hypothetical protein
MADGREIARDSGTKAFNRSRRPFRACRHAQDTCPPRGVLANVVEISVIFSGDLNVLGIFWRF